MDCVARPFLPLPFAAQQAANAISHSAVLDVDATLVTVAQTG